MRIKPPSQDKFNDTLFDILLPNRLPIIIAAKPTKTEVISMIHAFAPANAAPIPTAIPSKESATPTDTASIIERVFDLSMSAFSGFA